MYSLSLICDFLSIWCLYACSEKLSIDKMGLVLWISKNKRTAKLAACLFFIIPTILLIQLLGTTSGIFINIFLWTLIASCIVLFTPFPQIKRIHLVLIIILVILIEIIYTFMK